jgi:hypothetical protein
MRDDMDEVAIERPRVSSSERYHVRRRVRKHGDFDSLPSKEGMKRPYMNRKVLSDFLAPLERWLRKQVGRPWNKIYSEISRQFDTSSVVQKHIRDHVLWMVNLHVIVKSRWEVYAVPERWPLHPNELYVNAKGFLCKVSRRKKQGKK